MGLIRLNITHKFIAYLIFLSVIPLIIVGGISYYTSSKILKDEINRYTMALIRDQQDYLDSLVD